VRRRFAQFAWAVLAFNLLVILWGALVRASHSGEGCGDKWPLCNGVVVPHGAEIATLIEFTHRATTGIAFFGVAAMAFWARRAFRSEPVAKAALASLILIVTEALLGAGLVLFGFTGANASAGRAIYLSAHLINTLLMLAAMALTAFWASGHQGIDWSKATARPLRWSLLAAVAIAVTGSITALSDTLYPVSSLVNGFAADFSSASPILIRLRALHPAIAIIGAIYIAMAASRHKSNFAHAVEALVALQMATGLLNLYLLVPVWMQIVHLLFADLLWIALVLFTASALERSRTAEFIPRGTLVPQR
jgi:cytochrome c oxidase assembly protein subunit 15